MGTVYTLHSLDTNQTNGIGSLSDIQILVNAYRWTHEAWSLHKLTETHRGMYSRFSYTLVMQKNPLQP